MKWEIPFGGTCEWLEIPDEYPCEILLPQRVPCRDAREVIGGALGHPYGVLSLPHFLAGKSRPLVIVNDATRPTPTALVLELLYPYLEQKDARYLIATGAHRAPTTEEYRYIFRDFYPLIRDRVVTHDARESIVREIGRTRRGYPLFLNALLWEADGIIPIGSIEPHYFAGYTGGRKSFMPGVARYDCIEANHRLATSPQARLLTLDGNPVAEELNDAERLVCQTFAVFAIMTVLDGMGNVYAAATGDLHESFQTLLPQADEIFVVPVGEAADIVITVAREPMDIDLYQSQKAIENARPALKPGGIVILVSPCRKGTGAQDFLELLGREPTPVAVLDHIQREYRLGYHKAGKLAELAMESEIWAVTPLPAEVMAKAQMQPFPSVTRAVEEALRIKGEEARILILMDGGMTIPRPRRVSHSVG